MKAETLMIGTELLLGQIVDTNATHLAQVLAHNGINLFQKTTVGDNRARIIAAMDAALSRSDVVLCSGGLGPTEDDITRECIAELLGRPLVFHEALWETLLARFAHVRAQITENNRKQAMLPEGAQPIDNPNGTAPGLIVDDMRGIIICMPGVPMELKPMFEASVLPFLRDRFGLQGVLHYRVLKICGVGESRVDSMIGDLIEAQQNPSIGLLASPQAVSIRIAARAESIAAAEALIDPVETMIRARLDGLIMGRDEDTLESVVDRLLCTRGWRLGVVETSTGGMIAQRLSAARAESFVEGRVLRRLPEGIRAIDLAEQLLLDSGFDCALVVAGEPEAQQCEAVFISPLHHATWEIGRLGQGERSQLRTSIAALEQVRRALSGVTVEA